MSTGNFKQDMKCKDSQINRKQTISYFKLCLKCLPQGYSSLDSTRMVVGHFCLGGLDIFGAVDEIYSENQKQDIIDWIYSQQITSQNCNGRIETCGFRGGSFAGKHNINYAFEYTNTANLAATYSALCNLAILGDNFARVDRKAIIKAVSLLQKENGGFNSSPGELLGDVRFVYIACVIAYLLNDWSCIDKDKAVGYIKSCVCYDGGVTQDPSQESHGGLLYCAIASLVLMEKLNDLENQELLIEWVLNRQNFGFCGRLNKAQDTCYSFWVGSVAKMLNVMDLTDSENNVNFILGNQSAYGGISKEKNSSPDPLHSYLSLSSLSFSGMFNSLNEVVPQINLTHKTLSRLKQSCSYWN